MGFQDAPNLVQSPTASGTGPAGADEMVASPVRVQLTFWQHPYVRDLVPFISSVAIHITIILIAMASYAGYKAMRPVEREQVFIPDSEIMDGPVGGLPNPGLGEDPNRIATQDQVADASLQSKGWSDKNRQTLNTTLMGGGKGENQEQSLIALGPRGIGQGKSSGVSTGNASGTGNGDGSGQIAPFGFRGGGAGVGPRSQFLGVSGNAYRIAYVCDASGSMIDKFDFLRIELAKALDGLKPIQSFNIIFFSDGVAIPADKESLLMANPDNKRKAMEFLKGFGPRATSNPLPAIEVAFRQKAQLIYLLTDGEFPDPEGLSKRIAALNAQKEAKINTIAFVGRMPEGNSDDQSKEYVKFLRKLASENNGIFKYVTTE
jgi:hypothetical protein